MCIPMVADRMTDTCPLLSSSLPILEKHGAAKTGSWSIAIYFKIEPLQNHCSYNVIRRMQLVHASVSQKRV